MFFEAVYGFLKPDATLYKFLFLQLYPTYIAAIIISFSIIRSTADLIWVEIILCATGIIIAILALIEIFTGFNISHYLCFLNIKNCDLLSLHWPPTSLIDGRYTLIPRNGNLFSLGRYAGFTGQPNKTSIILGMCSIFIVNKLYKSSSLDIKYTIMLIVAIVSIMLSQTRAAIFSFALIFLAYCLLHRKSWARILPFIIFMFTIFTFYDEANNWLINDFFKNRLSSLESIVDNQRADGLKLLLSTLYSTNFLGVGGTIYSTLKNSLNSNDASTYLLYFGTGGIFLGSLYLFLIGSMIKDLFLVSKSLPLSEGNDLIPVFLLSMFMIFFSYLFNNHDLLFYVILFYSVARSPVINIKGV